MVWTLTNSHAPIEGVCLVIVVVVLVIVLAVISASCDFVDIRFEWMRQVLIPSSTAFGAVTLFATIRDPFSWFVSMSRHPYEMFWSRGWTCKLNSLEWLLQEVSMQTDESVHNPHE